MSNIYKVKAGFPLTALIFSLISWVINCSFVIKKSHSRADARFKDNHPKKQLLKVLMVLLYLLLWTCSLSAVLITEKRRSACQETNKSHLCSCSDCLPSLPYQSQDRMLRSRSWPWRTPRCSPRPTCRPLPWISRFCTRWWSPGWGCFPEGPSLSFRAT